MYNPELYHHGIMGMKWGVRRYQNPDGTLTAAGRARYGYKEARKNLKTVERNFKNISKRGSEEQISKAFNAYNKAIEDVEKADRQVLINKTTKQEKETYRKEMLKHFKGDKEREIFYKNATDEELAEDIQRKQNIKKGLIAATAAGIGIGLYAAYKYNALDVAKKLLSNQSTANLNIEDAVKIAMEQSKKDLGYVLKEGTVLHRMVGYDDFDMSKVTTSIYTTFTNGDRYAYGAFLKDWNGTGKRYDVQLKLMKDLKVASKDTVEEVFDNLWKSGDTYKKELYSSVKKAWAGFGYSEEMTKKAALTQLSQDKFKTGIYSIAKKNKDSEMLLDELKKRGYDAIEDYFDKGSLGEAPLIILDPQKTLQYAGQTQVDALAQKMFIKKLSELKHPMSRAARMA